MIEVKQHIPAFCDGFEPELCTVQDLEELLSVWWVQAWRYETGFDRFVRSTAAPGRHFLMVEHEADNNGERPQWVVAYLKCDESEIAELPVWRAREAHVAGQIGR